MRKVMIIFLLGIAATFFCFTAKQAVAETKQPNVLLIYHADNEEQKREVHVLDLLVGHFTNEITTVSVEEVDNIENINAFSHVFYLGVSRERLLDEEIEAIDRYEGPVFYIGNHISDFKRTSFLTWDEYKILTHIGNQGQEQKLSIGLSTIAYQAKEAVEMLTEGKAGNESLPVIFKRKSDFFMTTESMNGPQSHYLGESLFDFFQAEKGKPKKYLRIEDVHPNSDPEKLKAVADYLYEENIPYMIAVIPVYTNPETGKEVHLSDSREIVKILQYMQEHGGSIVMHGYKHQYRENETGEGFEYWDVKYDRPIYQANDTPVYIRNDFESDEEFQQYIKKGLQFERNYIQSTVKQGVDELLEQKLYPLAFEAPHYTMSSTGYKELANYFSTYVGQIQISDETYQATFTPLFESTPSYLGGMKLLPETLGYVDGSNLDSYKDIVKKAEDVSSFSDSYLSFFYHPYLGIELLKETIEEMKAYDEYEWLDLKKISNKVEVQDIVITSEDGRVSVERSLVENIVHKLGTMWWFIIPVIVFLIIIIVSMKTKRKNKALTR